MRVVSLAETSGCILASLMTSTATMQRKAAAAASTPKEWSWIAIPLSLVATGLSLLSLWLNYLTAVPVVSAKVEMIEKLVPGEQLHIRVNIENDGKSTAKQLRPEVAYRITSKDVPFQTAYDSVMRSDPNWTPATSDLPPGGRTSLISTTQLSLAHDHDVEAVLSGQWRLYVYGKIPYKDILHVSHEAHFCGYYQQVPGADPLKFIFCESYNETD